MFHNLYMFVGTGGTFTGAADHPSRLSANICAQDVCEGSFPPLKRVGLIRTGDDR